MHQPVKVKIVPLNNTPYSNVIRRLHWQRKYAELKRNPDANFPVTLYV